MFSILIASPIREEAEILKHFLDSLRSLNKDDLAVDYIFFNDNIDEKSENILKNFCPIRSKVEIYNTEKDMKEYKKDENTHYWNEDLIWKVAEYKNKIIKYFLKNNYDYLFLIDSDIVLHPETLHHLIKTAKDIISEIFWTKFRKKDKELPQVWLCDAYTLFEKRRNEELDQKEINKRSNYFLNKLHTPGVYKVGGLGACTLFKRKVLEKGVDFSEIYNLSFIGEDRHLCIRAVALGFDLYVDTCYPAYHIYRKSDLSAVNEYIASFSEMKNSLSAYNNHTHDMPNKETKVKNRENKITLVSLIYNEENRYLRKFLEDASRYIDNAIILDDGSTDNSVEICKEVLKDIPLTIKSISHVGFENELKLRKKLWELVSEAKPDWILYLDADEIFEKKAVFEIKELIKDPNIDIYAFRLYDFWDENHYREDKYWNAHQRYTPFLLRYQESYNYTWTSKKLHCGRFPTNIYTLARVCSDLRIKHYSWSREEDRQKKYQNYMKLDPGAKYGMMEQYLSILDPDPRLLKWKD